MALHRTQVAIAGGGMTGLALAVALRQAGREVMVLERQDKSQLPAEPQLRVSALNLATQRWLAELGVWSQLPAERCGTFHGMAVREKDSRALIEFSAATEGLPHLGSLWENAVVESALWQAAEAAGVQILSEVSWPEPPTDGERDISLPFLLFLTVFFAMIISDAGYGVLIVLVGGGLGIRNKVRGESAGPGLSLLIVMGVATVIWGALSGVWFGHEPIAEMAPFRNWIVPDLFAFEPGSIDAVIAVCFVLALIHLALARIWNMVRELAGPFKLKAVAELGWLSVLMGMFNLALTLVVSEEQYPFLPISLYLILGGIVAVIVFNNQEGSFIRGVLKGLNFTALISTGLDGINAFADTMSYLRLFAVGLASVEIAAATNQLAALAGEGLGLPVAILIILFGHSLNLAMGGLSVLVHGVRLNMLEFSGALGMEWSGSDYKPFRYNT